MADAMPYNFPCSGTFDDNPSHLVQFRGTGGPVRVSTCAPDTTVDTVLVVEERARGSCEENVFCSGEAAPEDVNCDLTTASVQTVEYFTELNTDYYVAIQQAPTTVGAADPVIGLSILTYDRPANDKCETAETLLPSTAAGATVVATTANASLTDFPCSSDRDDSPTVFYSIRGTGAKWKFSTCTDETDFATSLVLEEDFETCEDNPFCSASDFVSDASCEGAQELEIFSVENQAYLLAVQGAVSTDKGTFGLEFLEYVRPENDECATATVLEPSNSLAAVTVASTANATLYDYACSSDGDDVPVVFYELRGTGALWRISTCTPETEFETVLRLSERFETCEDNPFCSSTKFEPDFECNDSGFGQTHLLYSIENKKYMLALSGLSTTDTGVFGLSFLEYIRPENDQCETATVLTPSNHADPVAVGSTANATLFDFACSSDFDDTPVVFYEVRGTGARWRISTCTDETEFDTAIQMIADFSNCENENFCSSDHYEQDFECDGSGMGVSKEFFSVKNQAYMLALSGRASTDMGIYGLQFIEYLPPNNDECEMAEVLSLPTVTGEVILTEGSTANATVAKVACGAAFQSPNVFYRFRGTGDRVRISTCSNVTDFDTSISVQSDFDSCELCSFSLSDLEADFDCDNSGKAVSGEIMTDSDRMYSILVYGRGPSQRGAFGLTLEILPSDETGGGASQPPPSPVSSPTPLSDPTAGAPDSGCFHILPSMMIMVGIGIHAFLSYTF